MASRALGTGNGPPSSSAKWQATMDKVVLSVVSIRYCHTHSFDTDRASSCDATGFIVDADKGLIMTNRHVVGAGPFWGHCIFHNDEECDVRPFYADPVHDFGFVSFDPKAILYTTPTALELRPELVCVGTEVRMVGNDGGEKLSILSGVISRLDRNAPKYWRGYSDFNTSYIQAAVGASGGSSGSPIVNVDGYAIAIQAGGRTDRASTAYFLPLDRPLQALECLRRGQPVPRGDIQTQWVFKPFDDCRQLGLTREWESRVRQEVLNGTGMLTAKLVLPKGPADQLIEEGDVLIKVNGELVTQFIRLDEILDSYVAKKVKFLLQRNGKDVEVETEVGDLYAITPDRFVTVAGGSVHDLSYQQARRYAMPVKGLYVCKSAGSFRFEDWESGWIIISVNHTDTPDLDAFVNVMQDISDRERVVVTYKHLEDLNTLNTSIIHIDLHWTTKTQMAVRNDTTGLWDFIDITHPLPALSPVSQPARYVGLDTTFDRAITDITRSLVAISCDIPVELDDFPGIRATGWGLVVDEKGIIIVSRAIVPHDLCNPIVTIAGSVVVDAKVIFLHPLDNYALIQYDPSLVLAPVPVAKLSNSTIKQGAPIIFLGLDKDSRIKVAHTTVTDITTFVIPSNTPGPRYRAVNLDAITIDSRLGDMCSGGVLVAENGMVDALWLNYLGEYSWGSKEDIEYNFGLATHTLLPIIDQIRAGKKPDFRILDIEVHTVQISEASNMGVSECWIGRVVDESPFGHQLFMVHNTNNPCLQECDIILALNDEVITKVSQLNIFPSTSTFVTASINRKGQELCISVPTIPTTELETTYALCFGGATLQRPHHAVRQHMSELPSNIYVSACEDGSPADMCKLGNRKFITAVNGSSTPTLGAFLKEVNKIHDNIYFTLKVTTLNHVKKVVKMKKNEHYFPTVEFVNGEKGWERRELGRCECCGDRG